jgi:hypothetical protein
MTTTKRIQESTRRAVQEACRRYVLEHGRRYYERDFNQHSEALAAEDANIQTILLTSEVSDKTIEVLLHFTWYRFDTRASVEIAQRTLDLAQRLGNDRFIAEALCVLGGTYMRVAKDAEAEQCLTDAHQLLGKLPSDPAVSRIAAECIWHLYIRMPFGKPLAPTLSLLCKAQSKFSGDLEHAFILLAIGFCRRWHDQDLESIGPLRDAKDIFMRIENQSDAAFTLAVMARSYYQLSQLPRALACIEDASERTVNHPHIQADIEYWHGRILVSLDRKHSRSLKVPSRLFGISGIRIWLGAF